MPRPGRIYLAVDVNYFDDPDIVELSDAAQLLDLRAMCLAKRAGVDGRLTARQLQRIAPDSGGESLGELERWGIWVKDDDGLYLRRSWLAWNDSAEQVEIMSRGGKRGNHVKWHVRGKKPPSAKCEWCVKEGLVSPPTRPRDRLAIGEANRPSSLHNKDVDVDEYKTTTLADISCADTSSLRAGADCLEERVATVEEARAELEAAGHDEMTITQVLSLLPNLRTAS